MNYVFFQIPALPVSLSAAASPSHDSGEQISQTIVIMCSVVATLNIAVVVVVVVVIFDGHTIQALSLLSRSTEQVSFVAKM